MCLRVGKVPNEIVLEILNFTHVESVLVFPLFRSLYWIAENKFKGLKVRGGGKKCGGQGEKKCEIINKVSCQAIRINRDVYFPFFMLIEIAYDCAAFKLSNEKCNEKWQFSSMQSFFLFFPSAVVVIYYTFADHVIFISMRTCSVHVAL